MPNFYVLWATVRPIMFYETYNKWILSCSQENKNKIYWKIAVATEEQKQQIDNFNIQHCHVIVVNDRIGYNHAITVLTKRIEVDDNDILILLSDDFYPPNGIHWDNFILNKFNNYDGAVFLDDGRQSRVKEGSLCITLACMTFNCLKKLNRIVFHPDYLHFFSDNEAFLNLKELNLLKDERDIDNVVFTHNHYVGGNRHQDEYDIRNINNWNIDNATFLRRSAMKIEDRLR